MIVVMKRSATDQDIQAMITHVESLGLKPNVIRGAERTVIAAVGVMSGRSVEVVPLSPRVRRTADLSRGRP